MAVEDGLVSDPGGLPLISEGRAGRLFAIGDIHGCSTALKTLIEAIGPQPEDTIVVLGDVIDWGPDSRDCVQQLIDLAEPLPVRSWSGATMRKCCSPPWNPQSELRSWLNFGGEETLKSYPYRGGDQFIDPEHVRFLKGARDYYETDEFIFVHASYDPNRPMSQQSNTTLQWEFVQPEKMRPHYSGKTVVAGHTPQTSGEPLDLGFLKVIDTDCSRGGWLTALEVGSGRILQANQLGETRVK